MQEGKKNNVKINQKHPENYLPHHREIEFYP